MQGKRAEDVMDRQDEARNPQIPAASAVGALNQQIVFTLRPPRRLACRQALAQLVHEKQILGVSESSCACSRSGR
jgi:hypothetical protein